jgi:hypothetical protein
MKSLLKAFVKAIFPFVGYVRVLEDENQRLRETNQFLLDKVMTLTTGSPLAPRPFPVRQSQGKVNPDEPFHRGKVDPYALLDKMSNKSMENYIAHLKAEAEPPPVGPELPLAEQN